MSTCGQPLRGRGGEEEVAGSQEMNRLNNIFVEQDELCFLRFTFLMVEGAIRSSSCDL